MINFDEFESLEKEKPFFLLDQHPDGKHLEMHVEIGDVDAIPNVVERSACEGEPGEVI